MLSDIIGGIFILFGFLFLLFPESMRRRLRRKAVWKLRGYFFALAVSLGVLLLSAGWKHEGLFPKVLMIVGVVALLKGLLFLNSRATAAVTAWVLERPVSHLQMFALGEIGLGLGIMFGLA